MGWSNVGSDKRRVGQTLGRTNDAFCIGQTNDAFCLGLTNVADGQVSGSDKRWVGQTSVGQMSVGQTSVAKKLRHQTNETSETSVRQV